MSIVIKLLGMIILGVLSAALSYYKKNIYVDIFDDILGKDEPEKETTRVGRGFLYGFFFPVYFVLLLTGAISLIIFLIIAAILAAIGFVIVWVTEKIIPQDWFGGIMTAVFSTIGLSRPVSNEEVSTMNTMAGPPPSTDFSGATGAPSSEKPTSEDDSKETETNPDAGINVTRKHTLD
jgi:hypothetical protein